VEPPVSGTELRRALTRFALALALVAGLGFACHRIGVSSRGVLAGVRVEAVGGGAEALAAWLRAGVHGRVLLWFDRVLPTEAVSDLLASAWLRDPSMNVDGIDERFVYLAMRANVIRRVVFVVPDDRWGAFAAAAATSAEQRPIGRGFVSVLEGMPIVSIAARDRASVTEGPPLVYMSRTTAEVFGSAFAARLQETGDGGDLVLLRR
jgi:hypothetical protein